jgi:hypothetical protein
MKSGLAADSSKRCRTKASFVIFENLARFSYLPELYEFKVEVGA